MGAGLLPRSPDPGLVQALVEESWGLCRSTEISNTAPLPHSHTSPGSTHTGHRSRSDLKPQRPLSAPGQGGPDALQHEVGVVERRDAAGRVPGHQHIRRVP
jgi:hypothetical protein